MKLERAWQIVKELAEENVIDEQSAAENDIPDAPGEQREAIEVVNKHMRWERN